MTTPMRQRTAVKTGRTAVMRWSVPGRTSFVDYAAMVDRLSTWGFRSLHRRSPPRRTSS